MQINFKDGTQIIIKKGEKSIKKGEKIKPFEILISAEYSRKATLVVNLNDLESYSFNTDESTEHKMLGANDDC